MKTEWVYISAQYLEEGNPVTDLTGVSVEESFSPEYTLEQLRDGDHLSIEEWGPAPLYWIEGSKETTLDHVSPSNFIQPIHPYLTKQNMVRFCITPLSMGTFGLEADDYLESQQHSLGVGEVFEGWVEDIKYVTDLLRSDSSVVLKYISLWDVMKIYDGEGNYDFEERLVGYIHPLTLEVVML